MFDSNEKDRGQVGIGTLIVFIALVLVAAIAAGVLINTADLLQGQAQQTGQESTEQVTNNVNVISASGTTTADSDLDSVFVRVSKAPGSGDIRMSDATFRWVGEGNAVTMTTSDDSVSITGDTDLTDESDVAVVEITGGGSLEAGAGSGEFPLGEGYEATLTITTEAGGQTVEEINVPDILEADSGVSL
jgi:flagellin-like protein